MAKGMNRDRRREAQWRRMISEQGVSGLSIREFCRKANLSESAFYFWRHELQRRNAEDASATTMTKPQEQPHPARSVAAPAFVPVRVDQRNAWNDQNDPASGRPNGTEYRIEIVIPGGYRVHVTAPIDRQALAKDGRRC